MKSEFFDRQNIFDVFQILNEEEINYMLIKNIGNELPDNLRKGKDIDILVHITDYKRCLAMMKKHGYFQLVHPKGRFNGWKYLYGMHEVSKIESINGIQLDICSELCCKSILGNMWIPLDRSIQKSVWEDKKWNGDLKCWQMDDKNLVVYLLVRCIFDKAMFGEEYINEIEKRKHLLSDEDVEQKLGMVFFKFSDLLVKCVKQGDYERIIEEYYCYGGY